MKRSRGGFSAKLAMLAMAHCQLGSNGSRVFGRALVYRKHRVFMQSPSANRQIGERLLQVAR